MSKDMFSEDNEVKSSWIQWGKPGDNIIGTLVARYEKPNTLSEKKEMQAVYEIKVVSGEYHALENKVAVATPTKITADEIWNVGGKSGLDAQMRNVKIGQILGIKFMEEIPNEKKGFNAIKQLKVYTEGKMDEEWLKEKADEAAALDPNNF